MRDIAIIGAGAAGTLLVSELLRQSRPAQCRLHWWHATQPPGRGVAYATDDPEHLLNVRSAGIGMHADAPGDFLAALQAADPQARGSDFVPRRRYGDYLEHRLAQHLIAARSAGHAVHTHASEAVSARPCGTDLWRIEDDDGRLQEVHAVVLAVGATAPCPLPQVRPEALASGRYRRDPWGAGDTPDAPREVLVIGSGLTAVDVLLSAARQWPRARLTALSRHGRLPQEHGDLPATPYPHQASLHTGWLERPQLRHWLRSLRLTLKHEPELDWRALVDGLRPVTPALWAALDASERRRFLRHPRWLWECSRHRMPPASARRLAQLRGEGRLRVLAGRVRELAGAGPLTVAWQPRGSTRSEVLAADLVVQATGLGTDLRHTDHRLLRQLADEALVGIDPLGLGLRAQADGRVCGPDGTPWPQVYALGSLLRGSLWECAGLPEIRQLARQVAAALLTGTTASGHKQIVPGQFARLSA